MDSAEPQQGTRELDQSEVVESVFVVTHKNRAALRQPAESALHNPAPRLVLSRTVTHGLFFADSTNVRRVLVARGCFTPRRIVIAFVETQILWSFRRGLRTIHDDGLDRRSQQLRVVHVGAVDRRAQRTAILFDDQAAFRAWLAAIRWISADLVPPKRALAMAPSADCHSQLTPPSSSHSATITDHNRSITPFSHQRWNQRCTVLSSPNCLGSWFHWQPVRNRKTIPSRHRRQSARGRPVGFGGESSSRIGSMSAHNASGISQITASPIDRRLLRCRRILAPPPTELWTAEIYEIRRNEPRSVLR